MLPSLSVQLESEGTSNASHETQKRVPTGLERKAVLSRSMTVGPERIRIGDK